MPSGKYIRTSEIRKKISLAKQGQAPWNKGKTGVYSSVTLKKIRDARIGKVASDETRKKMGDAHRGISPSKITRRRLSVSNRGKKRSAQARENIRQGLIGRHFSDEARAHYSELRRGKNNHMYGRHHTLETKKKISEAKLGCPSIWRGKHLSDSTKRKLRLSKIRYLRKTFGGGVHPMYNPNACQKIDEYGKQHGYKFQHALNGGEFFVKGLGYWVDGYDKEKNVVVEYYEKHHRGTMEKDEKRKNEIINHLGCQFIEIKEWENGDRF